MSSSNLPLATLCLLLVALYAALSVVALRYFRYLRQKNSTQKPAEPRWTLAIADETGGRLFKMDIDTRTVDVTSKKRMPSTRFAMSSRPRRPPSSARHAAYMYTIPSVRSKKPASRECSF